MIIEISYKNLMKNLGRSYAKLMTTLQVSYKNVKFAAGHLRNPLSEAVIGRML